MIVECNAHKINHVFLQLDKFSNYARGNAFKGIFLLRDARIDCQMEMRNKVFTPLESPP